MRLLVISLGLLTAGAAVPLLWPRRSRSGGRFGVTCAVAAAAVGLTGALRVLLRPGAIGQVHLSWSVPYGSFFLEADPLSAFFLVPIFLLTGLAAVYGTGYLKAHDGDRPTASAWAAYNALTGAMVLVVLARNAVLFLVAWELMAVTSFLLVARDNERAEVRRAGRLYLVAGHLGTTALFLFFLLLGREAGSLDFDRLAAAGLGGYPHAGLLLALALIGFGTKAGLVPLHVWLPEAHPAAPSHVSAVMSGVMIKTGVYGIIRALTWLGPPPAAWAWALIGLGLITGVLGALLALTQRDLKRVLAYSSIENGGIILTGVGLGVLGQATGEVPLIILGYGGALLHVLNHALFKGLLFFGAGSVQCGAHTLDLEQLGGLQRRMPWTGAAFLVGAAAICGLPPLNGFVSEFTVLLGALHGVRLTGPGAAAPAFAVICGLGVMSGLAAAVFTRAFGIAFLGRPRVAAAAQARESAPGMLWPMGILAALCLGAGLGAPWLPALLRPVLAQIEGLSTGDVARTCAQLAVTLKSVVLAGAAFGGVALALAAWRLAVLARRDVRTGPVWGCGYARPAPRAQYTASSFAQPLVEFFSILRQRRVIRRPEGDFPTGAGLTTEAPDVIAAHGWRPVFSGVEGLLLKLHRLQTGSIHLYILYIAITLIGLLVWRLR
jgi:formate hydrogenlyase subunit 3/multisubunit Na+/H+ antiporter MnhD subunit